MNSDLIILIDQFTLFAFELVKFQMIIKPGICQLKLQFDNFFNSFRTIDVQIGFSAQETEGRDQPDQPEKVVAVQM
jgi:hypothetical protein